MNIVQAFPVDSVAVAPPPQCEILPAKDPFAHYLGLQAAGIEAVQHHLPPSKIIPPKLGERRYVPGIDQIHGMIWASHLAYAHHWPLALRPEDLWIPISQGYAQHVAVDPEAVRRFWTDSADKKKVSAEAPFTKGDPNADWAPVVGDLTRKLAGFVGPKKLSILCGEFSTTDETTQLCLRAAAMEGLSHYFDYSVWTCCGIPQITLLGEVADWRNLEARTSALAEVGAPEGWLDKLLPVVKAFRQAAEGNVDTKFFQEWYKLQGGSGGDRVSGHITALFPYEKEYKTGQFTRPAWKDKYGRSTAQFPSGISRVPFEWDYYGEKFTMALYAGFTGATFDEGHVMATVGWAVADETPPTPQTRH